MLTRIAACEQSNIAAATNNLPVRARRETAGEADCAE